MDIGLDTQEDADQLANALTNIKLLTDLCDKFPADPALLAGPGSELSDLLDELPEPQVDLRMTILQGIGLCRGNLELILSLFVNNDPPIASSVLPVLLRSALLGAGRVVFMLGPNSTEERVKNSTVVLQQEAESYHRAYTHFAKFSQFTALIPPAETIATYERRRLELMQGGRPAGEAKTLELMAGVIGEILARQNYAQSESERREVAAGFKEHISWIFHVYSGVAHGFAWPKLVPGTDSLPGHFIAELTMTVNVARLAADIAAHRAGITTSNDY